jgi:hypothetical protein
VVQREKSSDEHPLQRDGFPPLRVGVADESTETDYRVVGRVAGDQLPPLDPFRGVFYPR